MNPIFIILKKQFKDTFKNKSILIQFVMFPLLAVIMTNAISLENMPANFFGTLFASMYVGMAPLTGISAIISEEKEKHTLRVLLMAGVSPVQYLLGTGCYVFLACMPGRLILSTGILVSIVVGATIGIQCKNQMTAASVTVPVMMVLSFLPMLSMFNDTIAKIACFTYTEQIRLLIGEIQVSSGHIPDVRILLLNIVVFGTMFSFFYRKQGKMEILC
ncbi:MAG: ABC transporter permease [Lachnospiraceae bacterium]|nr:ABC transporter permease [Lachnospiraceae bacterium]